MKVKCFCLMDYVTCYHHSELLPKENSHEALTFRCDEGEWDWKCRKEPDHRKEVDLILRVIGRQSRFLRKDLM